jgi:hypothetical protein
LYPLLRQPVTGWVYAAHLPAWHGQENDIIDEIIQEAVSRTFVRTYKAEKQEAAPVHSITAFAKTTAHHYFIDLLRRDGHYMLLSQLTSPSGEEMFEPELPDIAHEVHEKVFCQSLFDRLAPEILSFPGKQKKVLLTDLANHTQFSFFTTPLQEAFLKFDVHLEDYQRDKPDDALERSRFASLLSLSYRRVSTLESMKAYIA